MASFSSEFLNPETFVSEIITSMEVLGKAKKNISRGQKQQQHRGICKYANGKCLNERTLKRNGDIHTLCEMHRKRACENQRKLDRKRRQERMRHKEMMQSAHSLLYGGTVTGMAPVLDVVTFQHQNIPKRNLLEVLSVIMDDDIPKNKNGWKTKSETNPSSLCAASSSIDDFWNGHNIEPIPFHYSSGSSEEEDVSNKSETSSPSSSACSSSGDNEANTFKDGYLKMTTSEWASGEEEDAASSSISSNYSEEGNTSSEFTGEGDVEYLMQCI